MKTKILLESELYLYENHLLELSEYDRYLRFGTYLSNSSISKYIESLKIDHGSKILCIFDKEKVVAACHYHYNEGIAEIGISVCDGYRGKGFATYLINIVVYTLMVKNKDVNIELYVINENFPIKKLINKYNQKYTTRPKLKEIKL